MANAWPEPVERVSSVLLRAAVEARIQEFPNGTPTAREAAEQIGCDVGAIVKSLVLVCDGAYVLALVPGDRRADERAVAEATVSTDVRVARPDEVFHATGFEPGAVAPFPQRAIARTLIERSLLARDVVWVGAGTSAHMAALQPSELQRLTRAEPVDLIARS
jgi:prolyl-tRNA editing enzyme YbaK/EbsC (Cys-tRNA(Pro) deacylase)